MMLLNKLIVMEPFLCLTYSVSLFSPKYQELPTKGTNAAYLMVYSTTTGVEQTLTIRGTSSLPACTTLAEAMISEKTDSTNATFAPCLSNRFTLLPPPLIFLLIIIQYN